MNSCGIPHKRKVISLALVGALAAMAQAGASADTTISTATTTPLSLGSGNLTITSSGSITVTSGDTVSTSGAFGTINNAGTLDADLHAIHLGSSTDAITNSGTITAGSIGIYNVGGTLGSLINTGSITATGTTTPANVTPQMAASYAGVYNIGTITTLNNSGTVTGAYGINNTGTISSFTNSGTITGSSYALYNGSSATLATINNSGSLEGNITNLSSSDLTIDGGSGSTFGSLTGYSSAIGTITNTNSNVVFGSGNLLLNDNINVGSNSVTNTAATLQVNSSITITGNYTQAAGATLIIGVADGAVATGDSSTDSGYGRLVVSGSATVASGSSVTLQKLASYSFAAGQRYVVIDASSTGTNYNDSTLNYSATGFNGTVTGATVTSGETSDLVLSLAGPRTTPATASNAVSSLGGLGSYTGLEPELLNLYNASLALGTTAEANRAGEQLSPNLQNTASRASTSSTFDVLRIVSSHSDSQRVAARDGRSGIATGESTSDWVSWGQFFGGHASQNEAYDISGFSANYGGLLLGADRAFGDRWRGGAVASYAYTVVDGADNLADDTSYVNAFGLIGYASYTGNPWYVNMSAGLVQQDYRSSRVVDFTGFSGTANSRYSGLQYVAKLDGGYPIPVRGLTLTPMVGLTVSHLRIDGYSESGGNGAALEVKASQTNSVRSSPGVKLEKSFQTRYGELVPYVEASWLHEFVRNGMVSSAHFVSDTTGETGFTAAGASPISNLADVAMGATLLQSKTMKLSARYELQAGSGYVSHTVSVRLRKQF
jgi:outer membrane autotransporter protein